MSKSNEKTECHPFSNIVNTVERPDFSGPYPSMCWSAAESARFTDLVGEPGKSDEDFDAAVAEEAAAVAEVCRIAIADGLLPSSCLLLEAAIRAIREDVDQ